MKDEARKEIDNTPVKSSKVKKDQSGSIKNKLDQIRNAIMAGTLASTRKVSSDGGPPIVIKIDGKKLMEVNEKHRNRAMRSGRHLHEIL